MRALSFEQALDGPFAEAMSDFNPSSWRPFLRSLDGNAPLPDQQDMFAQCTGRSVGFSSPPRQAQACCGRRSGKTRIAALIVATAACFWDHARYLSRGGERARIMLLATSKDQSSVAKNYILALLESDEVTAPLIQSVSAELISLSNRVDIVCTAASFRGVRGHSTPVVIGDEVAFWRDHETSVNPAKEIFRALAPGQSTVPQPLMLSISSPFSKEGVFFEMHTKHWGDDDSLVLAWKAASSTMNPTLPQEVIDAAYLDDPQAAAAEYGGEFRSDIASFIDRDVVQACIEAGRTQRGYLADQRYFAFCDPSGGSKDSFTAAVAHREGDDTLLDRLIEIKAPFAPDAAVGETVAMLREFGLGMICGDRYAGAWVIEAFKKHGVTYRHSMQDRSALYLAALPLLNGGRAQLLDNPRMVNQLCALQRRTGSSGKQSVDHPRNGADDLANAAMGALVIAFDNSAAMNFTAPIVWTKPSAYETNPSHQGAIDVWSRGFPNSRW
jgi:hypothetical protein